MSSSRVANNGNTREWRVINQGKVKEERQTANTGSASNLCSLKEKNTKLYLSVSPHPKFDSFFFFQDVLAVGNTCYSEEQVFSVGSQIGKI